ncbi:MAG TPA: LuxR C-terminal-related transcriptional regulator [Pyrinomonadaceae bacterium]|nr:LuxR C-terminal-related transcriptional regulator [Pyrinomonadaceae bacterium]
MPPHTELEPLRAETYQESEDSASPDAEQAMSLLAFSHTPTEHRLYEVMADEARAAGSAEIMLSIRDLMTRTGLNSYNTIRRARAGLAAKLSIECRGGALGPDSEVRGTLYRVFTPAEILERRRASGAGQNTRRAEPARRTQAFLHAVERVVKYHYLSQREREVALCCAEGLTNADIGERLSISPETVKFHLRHVFAKVGVGRRAELISYLLSGGKS